MFSGGLCTNRKASPTDLSVRATGDNLVLVGVVAHGLEQTVGDDHLNAHKAPAETIGGGHRRGPPVTPEHAVYSHEVPDDAGAIAAGRHTLLVVALDSDAGDGGSVLLHGFQQPVAALLQLPDTHLDTTVPMGRGETPPSLVSASLWCDQWVSSGHMTWYSGGGGVVAAADRLGHIA